MSTPTMVSQRPFAKYVERFRSLLIPAEEARSLAEMAVEEARERGAPEEEIAGLVRVVVASEEALSVAKREVRALRPQTRIGLARVRALVKWDADLRRYVPVVDTGCEAPMSFLEAPTMRLDAEAVAFFRAVVGWCEEIGFSEGAELMESGS